MFCHHYFTVLDISLLKIFITRNRTVLLGFKFVFLNTFLFILLWVGHTLGG